MTFTKRQWVLEAIARQESKHGSGHPFVKMLKQQLADLDKEPQEQTVRAHLSPKASRPRPVQYPPSLEKLGFDPAEKARELYSGSDSPTPSPSPEPTTDE